MIRKALTNEAREALVRQSQFLPWLAQRFPVSIPVPESLRDNVLVYARLPGDTLTPQLVLAHGARRVAAQVAELITTLHGLPVADCIAAGVIDQDRTENLLQALERTLSVLSAKQKYEVQTWRKQFAPKDYSDVMIHGDLWFENILIDRQSGRVAGILDFDTASIGDPAWDLATQLHLGPEFFQTVFEAYPNNTPELWERAHWLFQLRCFEGLDIALRSGDRAEFEQSMEKLRQCQVISW